MNSVDGMYFWRGPFLPPSSFPVSSCFIGSIVFVVCCITYVVVNTTALASVGKGGGSWQELSLMFGGKGGVELALPQNLG